MSYIQEHDYPGYALGWYRNHPDAGQWGHVITSSLAALETLVRVFEVELEIHHDDGSYGQALAAERPAGADAYRGIHPVTWRPLAHLEPGDIGRWVEQELAPYRDSLDEAVLETRALAARPPASTDAHWGVDVQAHGEVYHVACPVLEGTPWFVGPQREIGLSPPIEIALLPGRGRWSLELRLLWSAWETERGELDPAVRQCMLALEAQGWTR
jgi:hypothetical protein